MDKATKKALEGSIKKWEGIVAGKVVDRGDSNCPLCKRFFDNNCEGCPVREKTGHTCCGFTPYDEWCEANGGHSTANTPEKKKAARAMLAFLKALR